MAVGLTGGIGSGKSTVAKMFAELGIAVLDLDRVGHLVVADEAQVKQELVEVFGVDIVDGEGAIDRKMLAGKAFASAETTAALNAIVHPAIRAREQLWLSAQKGPYVIIEASVLIESGGAGRMDRVIVILADREIRKRRALARGDVSEQRFEQIVARQCDDATRIGHADAVIRNDGDFAELRLQVERIHSNLLADLGS